MGVGDFTIRVQRELTAIDALRPLEVGLDGIGCIEAFTALDNREDTNRQKDKGNRHPDPAVKHKPERKHNGQKSEQKLIIGPL
jgi:hypothetical protein